MPQGIQNKHIDTVIQPTASQFYMFVLYLAKTSNDFYRIQYSIKYTRCRTSLPQACGHRIVPNGIQLIIKSGVAGACLTMESYIIVLLC